MCKPLAVGTQRSQWQAYLLWRASSNFPLCLSYCGLCVCVCVHAVQWVIFDPINLLTHSQELALGCEPFAAALPSLTHTDSDQAKQTLGYDPALFTCKMGGKPLTWYSCKSKNTSCLCERECSLSCCTTFLHYTIFLHIIHTWWTMLSNAEVP